MTDRSIYGLMIASLLIGIIYSMVRMSFMPVLVSIAWGFELYVIMLILDTYGGRS